MHKVCLNFDWSMDTNVLSGFEYGIVSSATTNIDLPYCVKHTKAYFYRSIKQEDILNAKSIMLVMDGVQGGAIVYVNNLIVGVVADGYEVIDITSSIKEDISNFIRLDISNFDGSAGVAGSVYLLVAHSDIFIPPNGLYTVTSEILDNYTKLHVKFDVKQISAISNDTKRVQALVEVFDHRNKRKARKSKNFKMRKSDLGFNIPIKLNNPNIYNASNIGNDKEVSEEHPKSKNLQYMYSAKVTLTVLDEIIDTASASFGVRVVGKRGKKITYNGSSIRLNGVKIDNKNRVLGAISLPNIENDRVCTLKDNCYNIVRTKYWPTETFLNACDKNGIMCIVDLLSNCPNDMELFYSFKYIKDLHSIIAQKVRAIRNHPAVIAYCIGDSAMESYGRGGLEKTKTLVNTISSNDDFKMITAVVSELFPSTSELEKFGGNGALKKVLGASEPSNIARVVAREKDIFKQATEEYCALLDFVCYKDLSYRYEEHAKAYPKRLILGVEHEPKNIEEAISSGEECLNVIGDMGGEYCFDYYGKSTPANEYRQILMGVGKKAFIVAYDSGREPIITNAQENWHFPAEVGKPIKVDVFTNGAVVALSDEKDTLGRKLAGRRNQRKASFEVEYKPGNLRAVTYDKGSEQLQVVLNGLSVAKTTKMIADKTSLMLSKRRDMAIVDICILDKEGRVVTYANREITLILSEHLQVMAVGNSSTKKVETIQSRSDEVTVNTVDGRARFVIVGVKEGRAYVRAFCEGLAKSSLRMTVKA